MIADFGLSQFESDEKYIYYRCGTPGYVAPEVINAADANTRYTSICDIFSLGCIFHLLLTGKPAFPGRSYNTVVK